MFLPFFSENFEKILKTVFNSLLCTFMISGVLDLHPLIFVLISLSVFAGCSSAWRVDLVAYFARNEAQTSEGSG